MAKFPHAGAGIETQQITAGATAVSIDPDASVGPTNRILLMASASGAFFGAPGVTTASGFAIPTTAPIELWQCTPPEVWVIGSGQTVYCYFESPEGQI